jgi:hypothetical protein
MLDGEGEELGGTNQNKERKEIFERERNTFEN